MKRANLFLLAAALLGLLVLALAALTLPLDTPGRSVANSKSSSAAGVTAGQGVGAVASSAAKTTAVAPPLDPNTPLLPATNSTWSAPGQPASTAAHGSQANAGNASRPSIASSASSRRSDRQRDIADILAGVDLTIPAERERAAAIITQQEEARMKGVTEKARLLGVPILVKKKGGGISEIYDFEGDQPVYRTTFNANAGISSGANVLRGSGYGNLTGQGLTVGVWDGGLARPTHQEFATGQVTLRNPESSYLDHATHVAATLAGIGFQPDAQGMAPRAKIDSYFWRNDHGEMTLAGASLPSGELGKIPISNHSYGLIYTPLAAGHYDALARGSDAVAYGLPYYLQFWSAGNDQGSSALSGSLKGYFTIGDSALAKNVVTVGAVEDAVSSGLRDPSKADMSTFSSWGPAKDGRIKPDLVANGVDLYSAIDFSDQSYATYRGTSMASPSAAGTAALLVELYRRENVNQLPPASLLKALLIHTADDRGRPGPDYQYGWGLINGTKAGDLIRENKTTPRFFAGTVSTAARRWTHTFNRVGAGPIRATLVWADPPGEVLSRTSTDPNLVHNLDLKIVAPDGTTEHLPFVMPYVGSWKPADLTKPAVLGTNNVDNVEQISIPSAPAGSFTLVVTANGAMKSPQNFSVVLTGAGAPVNARPIVNLQTPQSGDWFLPGRKIPMSATATDLRADGSPGSVVKVEFLTNGVPVFTNTVPPYGWSDWIPGAAGTYTVEARATDNEGLLGYSSPAVVEVREPLPGEVHPAFVPPTPNDAVFALAEDDSERIYIGGMFTQLNGTTQVQRVARLSKAGVVDTNNFVLDAGPNGRVRVMAYRKEDKALYVGGDFTQVGGVSRPALAKLNIGASGQRDGSLDTGFALTNIVSSVSSIKASVRALVVQANGDILIGGLFDKVNGQDRRNIARLKSNGTVDPDFVPMVNGTVCALAVQADGKIVMGGEFTEVNGLVCNRLARVDGVTGATDTTLVLGTGQQTGFNGPIYSVAIDDTGNIYAGGSFNSYRGHPYHFNLIKIGPTGALQGNFNFEPGLNGVVQDVQIPLAGAVLASGVFTSLANNLLTIPATDAGRVAMFNADGTISTAFNAGGAGADGTVNRALRLSSGHYLMAGSFASFNGVARPRLALVAGLPPTTPVPLSSLVSRLRANSVTGAALDLPMSGGGSGVSYRLSGNLPRGMRFDATTGRLVGVPLESGYFQVRVTSSGSDGRKSEGVLELFVDQAAVSYDQWCTAWFGSGSGALAAPEAVNNPSGLSNFEVYAFSGGDPRSAPSDLLPAPVFVASDPARPLEWTLPRFELANHGGATNVVYRPEVASSLAGPWEVGDMVTEPGALKIRSQGGEPSRFMRIRLIRP